MNPKNLALATQLRRELHAHPELSMKEVWTKQHLIDFLKQHTKNIEIIDKGNWFYAAYRGGGAGKPNIAFRADFDAVPVNETCDIPHKSKFPGIAHKCGHDGHSAALAGLALEVDENGADKNVFFLFQHAEETAEGAIQCVDFIADEKIDEIYAFHNLPKIPKSHVGVREGVTHFASKGMTIKMKGSPSHASMPEVGKNPGFPIADIVTRIAEFTDPSQYKGPVYCTLIQIDVGEEAFGTQASEGLLRFTIRGLYEEEMNALQAKIENAAKAGAEKYGVSCDFFYQDEFPETKNHTECVLKLRAVCDKLGVPCQETETSRGSEDFGHFLKLTKGAAFRVGNGDTPPLHTSEFDFDDEIIETAVNVYRGLIDA